MMKWWGWGDPDKEYKDNGVAWPWMRAVLRIPEDQPLEKIIERSQIRMNAVTLNEAFMKEVGAALRADQIATDEDARLHHCYGSSTPDTIMIQKGIIRRAPDVVIFPEKHDDVEAIMKAAVRHDVCIIPYGGGTNCSGGVDPDPSCTKSVVTVDMARMNRVLSIDPVSHTAVIETGALGPKLEGDLGREGWELGHNPDSFLFSTLGGWISTRSTGMQSDAYGRIEDMVVALKVVTPRGTLTTRACPPSSIGPDLNRMLCGSEGTFGIITEATMRVHRAPEVKEYYGFLFRSFEEGVQALQECVESNFVASCLRLMDEAETELASKLKAKTGLKAFVQSKFLQFLGLRGYSRPAMMIVGFEGSRQHVDTTREAIFAILKKCHGFPLGAGVGKSFTSSKYDFPYLRDFLFPRGITADTLETGAPWSAVMPVHAATRKVVLDRGEREGHGGVYIGCHISHTYKTGACLYFTFGYKRDPNGVLEQYYRYKKDMIEQFQKHGGSLSHHHGIGYELIEFMEREVSKPGVEALRGIKDALDPQGICNPGKLIPGEKKWKLVEDRPEVLAPAASPPKKASHELS